MKTLRNSVLFVGFFFLEKSFIIITFTSYIFSKLPKGIVKKFINLISS